MRDYFSSQCGSADQLIALLDQVLNVPAGMDFDIRIVVNQAIPKPLQLSERHKSIPIFYRENSGYNIGDMGFWVAAAAVLRLLSFLARRVHDPKAELALEELHRNLLTSNRARR